MLAESSAWVILEIEDDKEMQECVRAHWTIDCGHSRVLRDRKTRSDFLRISRCKHF